ncbi:MAG: 3-deoxy-manno-octulosonate cytidylyltransferase [Verrucomicrobia bacterium]|nr:3-deoxy-manno-octulosonate cytidylyltransferase [Verrucomicrobiota bacterium]
MFGNKSVVCVIPARLASTRFPRKMLALLKGKPLVQWAYEGALRCSWFDEVIVAVDSEEILETVKGFGGRAIMTSVDCQNGTERLIELQRRGILKGDVWVNWQGDEPFIQPKMIGTLLQTCDVGEVWTLKIAIDDPQNPNVVKVVCDAEGRALYFSRSPIPHGGKKFFKHVGIYAYSEEALQKIARLTPCALEREERLEQLRFLYHGLTIQVHETDEEIIGIDTFEQLRVAEQLEIML